MRGKGRRLDSAANWYFWMAAQIQEGRGVTTTTTVKRTNNDERDVETSLTLTEWSVDISNINTVSAKERTLLRLAGLEVSYDITSARTLSHEVDIFVAVSVNRPYWLSACRPGPAAESCHLWYLRWWLPLWSIKEPILSQLNEALLPISWKNLIPILLKKPWEL